MVCSLPRCEPRWLVSWDVDCDSVGAAAAAVISWVCVLNTAAAVNACLFAAGVDGESVLKFAAAAAEEEQEADNSHTFDDISDGDITASAAADAAAADTESGGVPAVMPMALASPRRPLDTGSGGGAVMSPVFVAADNVPAEDPCIVALSPRGSVGGALFVLLTVPLWLNHLFLFEHNEPERENVVDADVFLLCLSAGAKSVGSGSPGAPLPSPRAIVPAVIPLLPTQRTTAASATATTNTDGTLSEHAAAGAHMLPHHEPITVPPSQQPPPAAAAPPVCSLVTGAPAQGLVAVGSRFHVEPNCVLVFEAADSALRDATDKWWFL